MYNKGANGGKNMELMSLQDFLVAFFVLWGLKSWGDGVK